MGGLGTTFDTPQHRQQARATLKAESFPTFRILMHLILSPYMYVCIHVCIYLDYRVAVDFYAHYDTT